MVCSWCAVAAAAPACPHAATDPCFPCCPSYPALPPKLPLLPSKWLALLLLPLPFCGGGVGPLLHIACFQNNFSLPFAWRIDHVTRHANRHTITKTDAAPRHTFYDFWHFLLLMTRPLAPFQVCTTNQLSCYNLVNLRLINIQITLLPAT